MLKSSNAVALAERGRAVLSELVAFDTTSRNSNLALIDYAEGVLHAAGARTRRIPNEDGTKANLWGVIGPAETPGGIVLSGHTDVVPVDGQDWDTDPWTLTEREGRLYARGACDMKGFVALALAAADDFAAAALTRPIHFALSYDEEVGCAGVPSMIDVIVREAAPIEAVLVGEPTEMKVVTGHKGLLGFSVTLEGREAHSSLLNDGVCAVSHAVGLMSHVLAIGDAMVLDAPDTSPFDPPHGTVTIGEMEGGTATNILARHARFATLMRPAPWDDPSAIEASLRDKAQAVEIEMQRTAPEARVLVERFASVPPLGPETDGAAERLARSLTGDNGVHVEAYGAEGGLFQRAGLSTVLCGPGSIAQAHQPNEFISLDQWAKGAQFLDNLLTRLSA